jgi:hypothetical protein
LTLPRLRSLQLTKELDHRSADVLTSFIRRSSCTLQQLSLVLNNTATQLYPALLLAVPHSVARLDLGVGHGSEAAEVLALLSAPNFLPGLKTLCFGAGRGDSATLPALANMLRTRRSAHPESSSLESFEAKLQIPYWKLSPALLAALQVLAKDGLSIWIKVLSTANSATTVIESGENGAPVMIDPFPALNKF